MTKKILAAALLAPLLTVSAAAGAGAFELHSSVLKDGGPLPMDQVLNNYGCEGKNIAPDLAWSGAPDGTKSFALTVFDPDAPGGGWWHWVVFDIPAATTSIATGAADLPADAVQSATSFGAPGYGGACPPPGPRHHYQFTLYAMPTDKFGADPKTAPGDVGAALAGKAIGKATLTALYGR